VWIRRQTDTHKVTHTADRPNDSSAGTGMGSYNGDDGSGGSTAVVEGG